MTHYGTDQQVELDYTSRDFEAIRAQLIGLAKGRFPEWETVGETGDMGTLLLELFAYMGDVVHFYIDRVSAEAFLGTAQRRQSVLYIADMLGYRPIGQRSASVQLEFNLDANAPEAFTLPAGTKVHTESQQSADVIVFELDTDLNLVIGSTVTGYATEGVTLRDQLIGVSLGSPTMELVLPEKGVVDGSLQIVSREGGLVIDWSEITDISLAGPTQSAFSTYLDDADLTHIIFGDNASGRVPPVNAEIFATYRVGVGAEANDLPAGSVTVINPTAEIADKIWAVTVSNPEAPLGGTDPESTDSMRYSIPRAAGRIKNRAITLADYADLALQVPGVAKATAYGTIYTSIHIRVAPVGGVQTPPSGGVSESQSKLVDEVEAYMADKILVGSDIIVEPLDIDAAAPTGIWNNVFLRLDVQVQPAYNRTQVRLEVEKVLRDILAFDNQDFGRRVNLGTIYRSAQSVQGVDWVTVTHLSETAPVDETDLVTTPDISDIVTDPILIPRFDPTEVIETTGDFPEEYLEEEAERTHDGLWVKAQGGLVGT